MPPPSPIASSTPPAAAGGGSDALAAISESEDPTSLSESTAGGAAAGGEVGKVAALTAAATALVRLLQAVEAPQVRIRAEAGDDDMAVVASDLAAAVADANQRQDEFGAALLVFAAAAGVRAPDPHVGSGEVTVRVEFAAGLETELLTALLGWSWAASDEDGGADAMLSAPERLQAYAATAIRAVTVALPPDATLEDLKRQAVQARSEAAAVLLATLGRQLREAHSREVSAYTLTGGAAPDVVRAALEGVDAVAPTALPVLEAAARDRPFVCVVEDDLLLVVAGVPRAPEEEVETSLEEAGLAARYASAPVVQLMLRATALHGLGIVEGGDGDGGDGYGDGDGDDGSTGGGGGGDDGRYGEAEYAAARASRPSLPVLPSAADGYYTRPSAATLARMSAAELAAVRGFCVARDGYGAIQWLDPVDLRGVDVAYQVEIAAGEVAVFERLPVEARPALGEGIQGRALITLENIAPPDSFVADATAAGYTSPDAIAAAFANGLAAMPGFQSFDGGRWAFVVPHFTRYGVSTLRPSGGAATPAPGPRTAPSTASAAGASPHRGADPPPFRYAATGDASASGSESVGAGRGAATGFMAAWQSTRSPLLPEGGDDGGDTRMGGGGALDGVTAALGAAGARLRMLAGVEPTASDGAALAATVMQHAAGAAAAALPDPVSRFSGVTAGANAPYAAREVRGTALEATMRLLAAWQHVVAGGRGGAGEQAAHIAGLLPTAPTANAAAAVAFDASGAASAGVSSPPPPAFLPVLPRDAPQPRTFALHASVLDGVTGVPTGGGVADGSIMAASAAAATCATTTNPDTAAFPRAQCDASLLLGRSFRVGWAPNGSLAHAGAPLGVAAAVSIVAHEPPMAAAAAAAAGANDNTPLRRYLAAPFSAHRVFVEHVDVAPFAAAVLAPAALSDSSVPLLPSPDRVLQQVEASAAAAARGARGDGAGSGFVGGDEPLPPAVARLVAPLAALEQVAVRWPASLAHDGSLALGGSADEGGHALTVLLPPAGNALFALLTQLAAASRAAAAAAAVAATSAAPSSGDAVAAALLHGARDAVPAGTEARRVALRAAAAAADASVWSLLVALWGREAAAGGGEPSGLLPHGAAAALVPRLLHALADPALHTTAAVVTSPHYTAYAAAMARREALLGWLRANWAAPQPLSPVVPDGQVQGALAAAVARTKAERGAVAASRAVHAAVLAALLRQDSKAATQVALAGGAPRLAMLVSQSATDPEARAYLTAQYNQWQVAVTTGGGSSGSGSAAARLVDTYLLAIVAVLCGGVRSALLPAPAHAGGAVPLLATLPWQAALAAVATYDASASATAREVVETYDALVCAGEAVVPQPWDIAALRHTDGAPPHCAAGGAAHRCATCMQAAAVRHAADAGGEVRAARAAAAAPLGLPLRDSRGEAGGVLVGEEYAGLAARLTRAGAAGAPQLAEGATSGYPLPNSLAPDAAALATTPLIVCRPLAPGWGAVGGGGGTSSGAALLACPQRAAPYLLARASVAPHEARLAEALAPANFTPDAHDVAMPWAVGTLLAALGGRRHQAVTRAEVAAAAGANAAALHDAVAVVAPCRDLGLTSEDVGVAATLVAPVPLDGAPAASGMLPAGATEEVAAAAADAAATFSPLPPPAFAALTASYVAQLAAAGQWHWAAYAALLASGQAAEWAAATGEGASEGDSVLELAGRAASATLTYRGQAAVLVEQARSLLAGAVPPSAELEAEAAAVLRDYALLRPRLPGGAHPPPQPSPASLLAAWPDEAGNASSSVVAVDTAAGAAARGNDAGWLARVAFLRLRAGVPAAWVSEAVAVRGLADGRVDVALPHLVSLSAVGAPGAWGVRAATVAAWARGAAAQALVDVVLPPLALQLAAALAALADDPAMADDPAQAALAADPQQVLGLVVDAWRTLRPARLPAVPLEVVLGWCVAVGVVGAGGEAAARPLTPVGVCAHLLHLAGRVVGASARSCAGVRADGWADALRSLGDAVKADAPSLLRAAAPLRHACAAWAPVPPARDAMRAIVSLLSSR